MKLRSHRFFSLLVKLLVINSIIAIVPLGVFLTNAAPNTPEWDLGFFVIKSLGFASVRVFIYTLLQRVILLLILLISFILIDKYYSYGFIVGIALQVYRIVGIFNPNIVYIDTWEWIYVIPIVIISIIFLYYVHRKLHDKITIKNQVTEIDMIIEQLKDKNQ